MRALLPPPRWGPWSRYSRSCLARQRQVRGCCVAYSLDAPSCVSLWVARARARARWSPARLRFFPRFFLLGIFQLLLLLLLLLLLNQYRLWLQLLFLPFRLV